jgi:hypothetical protein
MISDENAVKEWTEEDQKQARQLHDLMDTRFAARTNKQPELIDAGITLPAGDYYVGDPSYLLENLYETLDGIVKACNFKDFNEYVDKKPYFAYTEHGQTVVIFRTWIGDGIYADQESREYPVDSGMIGVVPVAMAHPDESRCSWTEYPDVKRFHRLTFAEPFLCKREDDGGLLVFGNVEIDTAGFWAAAAEIARGYTFVVWDWKQQIDVEELNAALQKIPGAVVTAVDTGVDAFALVVHTPTLQKTAEEWEELYHEEEEEQEEEADANDRY